MKNRAGRTVWLVVAAIALGMAGCSSGDGGPPTRTTSALTDDEVVQGGTLYEDSGCAVCHGETAEGIEGNGPALEALAPYWNVERLRSYLRDPQGFRAEHPDFEARRDVDFAMEMPAFDYLSDEELGLLARWLLTR